ncbi:MAG: F0F1 ATP synthase subunit B [Spirochaetales bacterium]|nr:F0F1 ATP synthase subunit B [Spirochaetales bacterium]
MGLFNIDPGLAIWTWITFGILFVLLSKFAFPSLLKTIKDREKKISDSIDNADRIEKQLARIEKEHKEIIRRSHNEADEILRKTRKEAEQIRKTMLEKAEAEAQSVLDQAKQKIAEEREATIESIRSELALLVCNTAEKVIGRSFVSKEDQEWTLQQIEKI